MCKASRRVVRVAFVCLLHCPSFCLFVHQTISGLAVARAHQHSVQPQALMIQIQPLGISIPGPFEPFMVRHICPKTRYHLLQ